MRIIISPSKEMSKEPPISNRLPEFIDFAKEFSTGEELTEDLNRYQAIHLYNGLQFRYLREGLSEDDFLFLDDYLRVISAQYGVVKPMDGIRHYRRDFTSKGLYKAWGDKIYQSLTKESSLVLNLASEEFGKTITRYATPKDRIVTVSFFEKDENGKLKKHASISKKGRGQLVNFIARHRITDSDFVKGFDDMGYQYNETNSDASKWVFIRPKD
ncbi:YaaA family protein [Jeotgalibaca sp. A122]|uniref:YaaA family protein n=1 Tax=Jeotgalibaca sp. A122 TaxID=3457322 RepID=UPI003FD51579